MHGSGGVPLGGNGHARSAVKGDLAGRGIVGGNAGMLIDPIMTEIDDGIFDVSRALRNVALGGDEPA